MGLDQPDGLLGRALLMGADREAEIARVDLAGVGAEGHPTAGLGDPLDADQDVHARILAFSGSKIGVLPTTATVTG